MTGGAACDSVAGERTHRRRRLQAAPALPRTAQLPLALRQVAARPRASAWPRLHDGAAALRRELRPLLALAPLDDPPRMEQERHRERPSAATRSHARRDEPVVSGAGDAARRLDGARQPPHDAGPPALQDARRSPAPGSRRHTRRGEPARGQRGDRQGGRPPRPDEHADRPIHRAGTGALRQRARRRAQPHRGRPERRVTRPRPCVCVQRTRLPEPGRPGSERLDEHALRRRPLLGEAGARRGPRRA